MCVFVHICADIGMCLCVFACVFTIRALTISPSSRDVFLYHNFHMSGLPEISEDGTNSKPIRVSVYSSYPCREQQCDMTMYRNSVFISRGNSVTTPGPPATLTAAFHKKLLLLDDTTEVRHFLLSTLHYDHSLTFLL
jgi:hypothetical protein